MMQVGDIRFIAYPDAVHYGEAGEQSATRGKKAINQLLWGDYTKVLALDGNWIKIRARGRNGWVRRERLQENRLLEVNFVDIGQGDGCHIQTPDDRALVIDAGEGDNMYRFLRWRFGRFARPFTFENFIISHPDSDHYYGFRHLFEDGNVRVEKLFHNGLVEQKLGGKKTLGTEVRVGRTRYVTGLVRTLGDLKAVTDDDGRRASYWYPNMLKLAANSGRVGDICSVLAPSGWQDKSYLPGFAPGDNRGFCLRVLGPVPSLSPGEAGLPWLGSAGETKNGHSVVLLLEIGNIRMLLGGDLNEPSQEYLLEHYTGLSAHPRSADDERLLVEEARKTFEVDVAKACHHGSAHVSPLFLQATNPLATIISSGDAEPHSHPRPDTLGLVGRFSRGARPLIFSTELARSGNEHIKHPNQVRRELKAKMAAEYRVLHDPLSSAADRQKAEDRLEQHLEVIQRSVANYGMINVRTDGTRMIVAQRLEQERSKAKRWDIYALEPDDRGRLEFRH
jgi:beta-lactamase superfamily II metal-dependent hydrolase